eukprot:gnl/MRDRNA2_/MRDRNA2_96655_c0_seq1.p1 gnl/MRDRNA2_/MRDRNA2_96655_c0~~gnl/MRDRNA2_/MRDRNA2_96655_c0_seq1.p1  ORF type:complete len:213 (+),score=25.90 gnl/MRDRNA2_/MRDRNA2_96655_c0_seq1:105-743(+)
MSSDMIKQVTETLGVGFKEDHVVGVETPTNIDFDPSFGTLSASLFALGATVGGGALGAHFFSRIHHLRCLRNLQPGPGSPEEINRGGPEVSAEINRQRCRRNARIRHPDVAMHAEDGRPQSFIQRSRSEAWEAFLTLPEPAAAFLGFVSFQIPAQLFVGGLLQGAGYHYWYPEVVEHCMPYPEFVLLFPGPGRCSTNQSDFRVRGSSGATFL